VISRLEKRKSGLGLFVVFVLLVLGYQGCQALDKQNWCTAHTATIDNLVQVSGMSRDSACSYLYERK
jgi:hypothetical protein